MPIAGLIRPSPEGAMEGGRSELRRMLELTLPGGEEIPAPFLAPSLGILQALPREGAGATPDGRIRCWMDGRFYNAGELRRRHGLPGGTLTELLAQAHAHGLLEKILPSLNGDFFAVLYDSAASTLILATDRLGLRPVYVLSRPPLFAFSSHLRGLLGVSGFSPELARDTTECFLDLGHLLGDKTWFEGVELLPPATLMRVDLKTSKPPGARRHWNWGTIRPQPIPLPEASEEIERLLKAAVSRRVLPGEKVSVPLSGGLDSRALLGCLPPEDCAGTATLGQPGCRDILYAERAAKAAGVAHATLPLTEGNWDRNRFHAIWKCDGMSSLGDLSGSQFLRALRAQSAVALNGFAGDLVAGGSYLKSGYLDVPADSAFARMQYGKHARWAPTHDPYLRAPHTDPYVLAHRVRRLTVAGTREVEDGMEQRKPFMDFDLLDFLYSLPDGHRRNGKVYRHALLRMRPDLFAEIPWQQTGLPVSAADGFAGRLAQRGIRLADKLGWTRTPVQFQDLPRWLAASSARYAPLLEGADALWPHFVSGSYRERFDWRGQLRTGNTRLLLHAIGLEVWLQQIFNGRYRDPDVPEA